LKPRLIVAGILLAVAVLAVAGMGSTVPVTTIYTVTQESTRLQVGYFPTILANSTSYSTTIEFFGNLWVGADTYQCLSPPPDYEPCYLTTEVGYTNVTWTTETLPYTYTATRSRTEVSTTLMPAYSSVGLTGAE